MLSPLYEPPAATLSARATPREALLALIGCPNICSRRPLFERYDSIVQSRTVRRPEHGEPHAEVELFWEGGARSELRVRLNHRGAERRRTDEGTIALGPALADHLYVAAS